MLELGPEAVSPAKHGPGSTQTGPTMSTNNHHSPPKRPSFGHEQQGLFSSRMAALPREVSPEKTSQYVKVEYPNGVIIHDTRNQGRIPNHVVYQAALQLNGTSRNQYNSPGKSPTTDYIEVVSGPSKRGEPPPYYYPSSPQVIAGSKSTVL